MDEGTKGAMLLARSEKVTKETIAAQLFDLGYGTTVFTCWDGLSVFNTAHLVGKGGSFSNQLSTPSALNQSSIESLCINIKGALDYSGMLANIAPKKLVVPRSQAFNVQRIMGSFLQSDNANNQINALMGQFALMDGWMVNDYLQNQTNWFITTDVQDGLKFIQRSEKKGEDNDFGTSDFRYKVSTRFSTGLVDTRGVWGSGNAGS